MKHHVCGRLPILEGEVQPLEREELDPYGLKLPLRHGDSGLVMTARGGGESPHTTDGAIAYELWSY